MFRLLQRSSGTYLFLSYDKIISNFTVICYSKEKNIMRKYVLYFDLWPSSTLKNVNKQEDGEKFAAI